ncbi:MAG: hypothetical protein WBD23_15415, partial [Candidatus Acidiferrales bacterium]
VWGGRPGRRHKRGPESVPRRVSVRALLALTQEGPRLSESRRFFALAGAPSFASCATQRGAQQRVGILPS